MTTSLMHPTGFIQRCFLTRWLPSKMMFGWSASNSLDVCWHSRYWTAEWYGFSFIHFIFACFFSSSICRLHRPSSSGSPTRKKRSAWTISKSYIPTLPAHWHKHRRKTTTSFWIGLSPIPANQALNWSKAATIPKSLRQIANNSLRLEIQGTKWFSNIFQLVCYWRLVEGVRAQMEAVRRGFQMIINKECLRIFSSDEMELLFCKNFNI